MLAGEISHLSPGDAIIKATEDSKGQTKNSASTSIANKSSSNEQHERIQICEECAEKHSSFFCPKCEQALCQNCWTKIHNKGARARHR